MDSPAQTNEPDFQQNFSQKINQATSTKNMVKTSYSVKYLDISNSPLRHNSVGSENLSSRFQTNFPSDFQTASCKNIEPHKLAKCPKNQPKSETEKFFDGKYSQDEILASVYPKKSGVIYEKTTGFKGHKLSIPELYKIAKSGSFKPCILSDHKKFSQTQASWNFGKKPNLLRNARRTEPNFSTQPLNSMILHGENISNANNTPKPITPCILENELIQKKSYEFLHKTLGNIVDLSNPDQNEIFHKKISVLSNPIEINKQENNNSPASQIMPTNNIEENNKLISKLLQDVKPIIKKDKKPFNFNF